LRRVPFFVVVVAALLGALPAAASLTPVRRSFGELQVARVRSGHIRLPAGHANGRIRVVVQLRGAPLARWSRGLSSTTTSSGRLDVSTSA
jgi:hypothetical protein